MATACLGGLPAFISAATLVLNALGVGDFLSGILLAVNDGVVDDDSFRQRTRRQITQRQHRRPSGQAGHIACVRARRANAADVQDDYILGADQAVGQRKRSCNATSQRRAVHGNLTRRLVERDARGLVGRLRDRTLRRRAVTNLLVGEDVLRPDDVLIEVRDANRLRISHDHDPIQELVTLDAEL